MKNLSKVVFFGSHELAVPALDVMAGLEVTPSLIVTQPEAGYFPPEGEKPPHAVGSWAQEHNVEVVHSQHAAEEDLRERITSMQPDLIVVVDYGNPLPFELAEASTRGAIEVQPSLLPHLAGPHAVRATLAQAVKKTGVTIIDVNEDPWGGAVLFQEEVELNQEMNFLELFPSVQELSENLLAKALKKADKAKGRMKGKPQKNPDKGTPSPTVGERHRKAPWPGGAKRVYDRLRAYAPFGINALLRYRPIEIVAGKPMDWVDAPNGATGTFLGMRQGKLAVLCGESSVFGISRLRWLDGESPILSATDFSFKEKLRVGDRFA